MTPSAPLVAAALSAVLSSGLTAAYLRATMPDTLAVDGGLHVTPEQRHLAALVVAPGGPYTVSSGGGPLDARGLGTEPQEFERGWQQFWETPGDERVTTFLVEFRDAAAARSFTRGLGGVAARMADPEPFLVDGVPDAGGVADATEDSEGRYLQAVVMHRGTYGALLLFATEDPGPGGLVAGLVQRQWAALGRV